MPPIPIPPKSVVARRFVVDPDDEVNWEGGYYRGVIHAEDKGGKLIVWVKEAIYE